MQMTTHLTSKGQMTIPKLFREAIGVAPNEPIEMNLEGDCIIIRRKEEKKNRSEDFEEILRKVRALSDIDLSTEEIMCMTRGNDWNSATPHD